MGKLKCPTGERAYRKEEMAAWGGQTVHPCALCHGWHRTIPPVTVVMKDGVYVTKKEEIRPAGRP